MSSNADVLTVVTTCSYLTDISRPWRSEDYGTAKMVKALKGEAINGYFTAKVSGSLRRFDASNIDEFLRLVPGRMRRMILERVKGPATLVPIPNSHVTSPDSEGFKTRALAEAIAFGVGDRLSVVPALVFEEPQTPSHRGGPRSPTHFEQVYRVTTELKGPIVLVDDVFTTGGHMTAGCWKLNSDTAHVVLGCAFGRTTHEQQDKPFSIEEHSLDLRRTPAAIDDFDFDF